MIMIDPPGCEPLRAWARLEPRSRQVEFDTALQARVHDPLWMLARQWQFSEFKGEDAGSPIFAKMARRVTPIGAVRAGGTAFQPYNAGAPLEGIVERLPLDWTSPTRRASAGQHFVTLLSANAASLPAGAAPYIESHYADLFARAFPISYPPEDTSDPAKAAHVARRRAAARTQRTLAALAGRAIDGRALAAAIPPKATWADVSGDIAIEVLPDHRDFVLSTLRDYRDWFTTLHLEPQPAGPTAWVPEQLEYQFACTIPRGDSQMVLVADEYTDGRLDWYAFDQIEMEPAPGAGRGILDVKSVLPAPVVFGGMPRARFWQFEDAAVDLGSFDAEATDLAKILVAEFALLFGNNWFAVPYRQPVGTLAEIEGLVVTDVFGKRTWIDAATGGSDGDRMRWDFWSLAARTPAGHVALGQHLFLPPTTSHVLESEPIEKVTFVRDEMANLVWAVETRVPDGDGRGRDGAAFARQTSNALRAIERGQVPGPETTAMKGSDAALRFRLGTTVPENWIPFVPVHKPSQTRAIRLQRASMPRFFLGTASPVRPTTSILRPGLRDLDEGQDAPLYLHEEEMPASGLTVEGSLQRARWFGGTTFLWHGRRVSAGRGTGGSGLRFDIVEQRSDETAT
ncbi:MAG: hypothetical protein IOD05_00715 [Rhodobacter sp.]|nr:hypothetical protein [Rhodobacter sp.]